MATEASNGPAKLVSIVCRSIGRPELEQTLNSIAKQTYPSIEIILVEALGESLAAFHQFANPVVVNSVSSGAKLTRSNAANAGLDSAQGDYIMFLDDDDWIGDTHVATLVQALSTQSKVKAAYSCTQKMSADGKQKKEVFDQAFDSRLLMRDNFIPIHSMLFESVLLKEGCRFDNNFDVFEDWDFWLQLNQHTDFLHIASLTAFYRDGGDSETSSETDDDRFLNSNPRGKGRAKLFDKWLKIWNGEEINTLFGSMDNTDTIIRLNETVASLHSHVQHRDKEVVALIEQLDSEFKKHQDTHARLERSLAENETLSLQLDTLHKHASALDSALRSVLESTSWKLTGPYRRIGRVLKGLLGGNAELVSSSELANSDTATIAETAEQGPVDRDSDEWIKSPQPLTYVVDRSATFGKYFYVRGWAVKSPNLVTVNVLLNGKVIPTVFGSYREDVKQAFPLLPGAEHSGFSLLIEADKFEKPSLQFVDSEGQSTKHTISPSKLKDPRELINEGEFLTLDLKSQYGIYRAIQEIDQPAIDYDAEQFEYSPLISIIVPVYNVEKRWLDACINSVLSQTYRNWELCLHDDASTDPETLHCLRHWQGQDARIKVQFGETNQHIAGASNGALEIASGEFIGLMDNDDELDRDALWHVVHKLNENSLIDYIYTDEDKIDENGDYCDPHFKPDWSPETLESMMYVGHFGVIRRSVIDAVGGFRMGLEGSQDYDLTLRISRHTQNFAHIPRVLYHWRIIPGSVSGGGDAKGYAYVAAINALTDHVADEVHPAKVSNTEYVGLYRIQRESGAPSVTIILPFHNKAEMTIDCLRSIEQSTYKNFKILLISNNSEATAFAEVGAYASDHAHISVHELNIPFNWSAINNWGVQQCDSDYVLLLNNDMTIISEDWIESLLDSGIKKGVGAVGARLLFEDDTVQHAGIVMQMGGIAGHSFKFSENNSPGYFGYSAITRNCAAVTGACMLIRRSVFKKAGGFNEELRVAYNDVDFCLRLQEANLRIVYTPFAQLYHFESKTRPKTTDDMSADQLAEYESECAYIRKRHAKYFEAGDPYYNPALTLKVENYSLKY